MRLVPVVTPALPALKRHTHTQLTWHRFSENPYPARQDLVLSAKFQGVHQRRGHAFSEVVGSCRQSIKVHLEHAETQGLYQQQLRAGLIDLGVRCVGLYFATGKRRVDTREKVSGRGKARESVSSVIFGQHRVHISCYLLDSSGRKSGRIKPVGYVCAYQSIIQSIDPSGNT